MPMYCTATVELNQFKTPLKIVDGIKKMNFDGTFSSDVVFVGTDLTTDLAVDKTLVFAVMLKDGMFDNHEPMEIFVRGENDLDSFEVIISDKKVYIKKAVLI